MQHSHGLMYLWEAGSVAIKRHESWAASNRTKDGSNLMLDSELGTFAIARMKALEAMV